jgi:hypothetical protein
MAPTTASPGTHRRCLSRTWRSSSEVQVRLQASDTQAPAAAPRAAPFHPACTGSRGGASAIKETKEAHARPRPACVPGGVSEGAICPEGAFAAMARSTRATGPAITVKTSCSSGGPNIPLLRTIAAVVRMAAQTAGKRNANHGLRAAPPQPWLTPCPTPPAKMAAPTTKSGTLRASLRGRAGAWAAAARTRFRRPAGGAATGGGGFVVTKADPRSRRLERSHLGPMTKTKP